MKIDRARAHCGMRFAVSCVVFCCGVFSVVATAPPPCESPPSSACQVGECRRLVDELDEPGAAPGEPLATCQPATDDAPSFCRCSDANNVVDVTFSSLTPVEEQPERCDVEGRTSCLLASATFGGCSLEDPAPCDAACADVVALVADDNAKDFNPTLRDADSVKCGCACDIAFDDDGDEEGDRCVRFGDEESRECD